MPDADPETLTCDPHDERLGPHHDRRCSMFFGRREDAPDPERLAETLLGRVAAAPGDEPVDVAALGREVLDDIARAHLLTLNLTVGRETSLTDLVAFVEQAQRLGFPPSAEVRVRQGHSVLPGIVPGVTTLTLGAPAHTVGPPDPWTARRPDGSSIMPCCSDHEAQVSMARLLSTLAIVDCPGQPGIEDGPNSPRCYTSEPHFHVSDGAVLPGAVDSERGVAALRDYIDERYGSQVAEVVADGAVVVPCPNPGAPAGTFPCPEREPHFHLSDGSVHPQAPGTVVRSEP